MSELKDLLNELSEQARTYDVTQRAKAGGVRRRRRKRLMAGGGAMLSVMSVLIGLSFVPRSAGPVTAATPSATPSARCEAGELPRPAGYQRKSFVTGADPSGRFVLGRVYPEGQGARPVIWDNGAIQTVAMAGEDTTLEDITTSGVAIGTSFLGDNPVSWVYRGGKTTRLAGDNANAMALNENLMIVGTVGDRPAIWRSPSAQPEPLSLPPGEWARGGARGISDEGYIVGFAVAKVDGKEGDVLGLLWGPDGTFERLVAPGGYPVGPTEIRGDWILGRFTEPGGRLMNVRWERGSRDALVFPEPVAWTVNAMGWAAGSGAPALTLPSGDALTLPTAGFSPDGVIESISDDGHQVVGTLYDAARNGVAVRWICR
jgi:hypothetical protein